MDLIEDDDLRSPCIARVLSHLEKRGSGMEQEAVAVRILKLGLDVPGVAGFVALAVVVGHDIPENLDTSLHEFGDRLLPGQQAEAAAR